jgi:hypothetical protein
VNRACTIRAWYLGKPVEVPAAPTPVPGLYVNASPTGRGGWCVTHAASGGALAISENPEHALGVAITLGGLADWTLPGAELRAIPGLGERVFDVVLAEDAFVIGNPAPPEGALGARA